MDNTTKCIILSLIISVISIIGIGIEAYRYFTADPPELFSVQSVTTITICAPPMSCDQYPPHYQNSDYLIRRRR